MKCAQLAWNLQVQSRCVTVQRQRCTDSVQFLSPKHQKTPNDLGKRKKHFTLNRQSNFKMLTYVSDIRQVIRITRTQRSMFDMGIKILQIFFVMKELIIYTWWGFHWKRINSFIKLRSRAQTHIIMWKLRNFAIAIF